MSIILETRTLELVISDNSDFDQHTKKRVSCDQKSCLILKIPTEHNMRLNEEVFTTEQTDAILCALRTFPTPDGLKITNCIFRSDHVEICYFSQGSSVHDKDALRQQLANHLTIDLKLIKITKLRAKPIYKETSIRPGETASVDSKSLCKIGAFVKVEGIGIHALTSAHGKNVKDVLRYPNGDRLGAVSVALHPPLQTPGDGNWHNCYRDVALVRLDEQDRYITQVFDDNRGPLGLAEHPIYATNDMTVRRFTNDGRRGRVDSASYHILDEAYNIMFRLISVVGEDGGPIHEEGESGILVVTDAAVDGRVNAVGILVLLEKMNEDDEEQTVRQTSLAVPLPANFEALRKDPYCREASITFLN